MEGINSFKFVLADSESLKQAVFRLRYTVYVEEFGFERSEDHPHGYETDEYETDSIHLAALSGDGNVIGTVRLVLHSEKGFPLEHATTSTFIGEKPDPTRIAEISRLAVSKTYRRRAEDGLYGVESYILKSEGGILPDDGHIPQEFQKRKRPAIILGLFKLLYHTSKRRGLTHWYLVTERRLFYLLRRYGFLFQQIGDPVNYHGVRIPYLGNVEEIEQTLAAKKPEVLQLMLTGLEEEYHPRLP